MVPRAAAPKFRWSALAILTIATSALNLPAAADSAFLENDVKAAYLSKIGLFVEWPKSAFAGPTSAITVCVAGENPFGDALDKVVEGQRVGGRPIQIHYLKAVAGNSGCDILYVAGSGTQSVADALNAVDGSAVLTVTDAASDDHAAGIIEFVVQNNRVRFNIDEQAAARNGISISPHLISLALSVRSKN